MHITNALPQHLQDVYTLICDLEAQELSFSAFSLIYSQNLAAPNVFYLVAIEGDRAVGFAALHIQALLHHAAPGAEVQELVVAPHMRGYGTGTALFDEMKIIAKRNGACELAVCCNLKRTAAHGFYKKQGMAQSHYKFTLAL